MGEMNKHPNYSDRAPQMSSGDAVVKSFTTLRNI